MVFGDGTGAPMEEYRVRYRDPRGDEQRSPSKPTLAEAVRHAHVLELHRATILAVVGPAGELKWLEAIERAAATAPGKPAR
jgi:hypothetical protein